MKARPIPVIIMLTAGFVACVVGIIQQMDMEIFVKTVLVTMVIFLLLGQVVRIILERNIQKMADIVEEPEDSEENMDEEPEDGKTKESDGDERE